MYLLTFRHDSAHGAIALHVFEGAQEVARVPLDKQALIALIWRVARR